MTSWSLVRWLKTWVSTWSTAGVISLCMIRSTSRSGWKLLTPIDLSTPSRCSLSMARHGPQGRLVAGVCEPEFRGDEQLVAADAARRDRAPNRLLVSVRRRGVEQPIADGKSIGHRALTLVKVGDLE